MRNFILFMMLFLVATIDGQPFEEERNGTEELRSMLRQSLNQNRKLQQQMDRLKLVWSGLSQMCQALGQHDCACGDNSENSPVSKEADLGKGSTLRILSVKSSGNQSNTVNLTVTYTAEENHGTDWTSTYYKFDMHGQYRIAGEKVRHGSGKFSSSAAFTDLDLMGSVFMSVYSGSETAQVRFDSIAITKAAEQILPEYNKDMLNLTYTQTAPLKGDMNISIEIRGTLHESSVIERAELYFTAVNTSLNPPTIFEASPSFTTNAIGVSAHPRTSNTSTLVVTLHESLHSSGGILTIRAPPTQVYKESTRGDLMTKLLQGYSINVLSAESGLVVPNNTVGLYKTGNITVVTPFTSIMCAAMGNPFPDVQVYKVLKDGKRKRMKTYSIKFDEYAHIATYTLRADDKKTPGMYVCRAKSGTAVVEDFRGVQVYKVEFDEAKTGVVKNNTRKVVFGCKVTWTMEPELEFRLYRYNGPVIRENDIYEVSTQRTGKRSSRITLSVSPPDEAIHTVVCVAHSAGVEDYKKIELFPGEDRDENWDMYDGHYVGNQTIPFY